MKKYLNYRLNICLLGLVIFTILLSGCKGKELKDVDTNTAEITQKTEDETSAKDVADESEKKPNDHARYEAFLNGAEPVYLAEKNVGAEYEGVSSYKMNTPYLFTDIMEEVLNDEYSDEPYSIESISYAYFDAGADGVDELSLILSYNSYGSIYEELFIIKEIEDKLFLTHMTSYGYRTYAWLNKLGYIIYSGSNGAASSYTEYKVLDENANPLFYYGLNSNFSAMNMPDPGPDYVYPYDLSVELGIENDLYIEEYHFHEHEFGKDISEVIKDYKYVMFDNEPESDKAHTSFSPDSPYQRFINEYPMYNFVSKEEIEKELAKKRKEINLTDEIMNAEELSYTELTTKVYKVLLEKYPKLKEEEAPPTETAYYSIENPSYYYYNARNNMPYESHCSLELKSKEANQIIDEDDWFYSLGMERPNPRSFYDKHYGYYFTIYGGSDSEGELLLDISNSDRQTPYATLDFSKYMDMGGTHGDFGSFAIPYIRYAMTNESTLYVCISHNTYAESAPNHAYILALDMEDNFRLLWKSDPLVCNADMFDIKGHTLICGYGFTAEPDYLYLLDTDTGMKMDQIKVKSAPEYIVIFGDTVYVRCYDTNYEFLIKE